MSEKFKTWAKALLAATITGAAGSLLSALGISGAQAAGVNVMQLDLKQLWIMTLAGGVVGAAAYLKQSPMPPDS
jgi:hypothetical protein